MSRFEKELKRLLSGFSDNNLDFDELRHLLRRLGFKERINGSHHLFSKEGIRPLINLQFEGGKAKPYQVKQVRKFLIHHKIQSNGQKC